MKNEVKQSVFPLIGMDGFPVVESELRKTWPGWRMLAVVGQVGLWLCLFIYSGPLIRWFDPSAGSLDPGILSELSLTVLIVDVFVVMAWLFVRMVRDTLIGANDWDEDETVIKKGVSACLITKIVTGLFLILVSLFFGVFVVLL
ncbi:hypothetical protein SAMN05216436_107139 [bacterium A37T11]|nr:hypothetical protein SAMN05216436_107139 [bacterium A37T11]